MTKKPTASRIAKRAGVICCLMGRGFIEGLDDIVGRERVRSEITSWYSAMGLDSEADEVENRLLFSPIGTLSKQEIINCGWLCEGLVVLLWSLGRSTIGPIDEQVANPRELATYAGFLDIPKARLLVFSARIRPRKDIAAYAQTILNVHWRLRDFSLTHGSRDCRKLFSQALGNPIPGVAPIALESHDLRVFGGALTRDHAELHFAGSIVRERHRAANWLMGDEERYSEVTTDT